MTRENFSIAPIVRGMLAIEAFVLISAGVGLFFAIDFTNTIWGWQMKPFNGGFLGAIYLAALMGVVGLLIIGRWNPARLIVPMIFSFTAWVLVITLFYWKVFDLSHWGAWVWIVLYIAIPIISGYYWWKTRTAAPVDTKPTPALWANYLRLQMVVLTVYALGMLVIPETITGFWPWKLDAFHTQLYAATGLSGAVGSYILSKQGSSREFLLMGLMQLMFGVFSILDVVLKSAKVDYSTLGTWLWFAVFIVVMVSGIGMIIRSRQIADK